MGASLQFNLLDIINATSDFHVLNDQVRSAEVDEALELLDIAEPERGQHLAKHLLAAVLVDEVAVGANELVALHELLLAVLADHVLLELGEFAGRDVDHRLLRRIGRHRGHVAGRALGGLAGLHWRGIVLLVIVDALGDCALLGVGPFGRRA